MDDLIQSMPVDNLQALDVVVVLLSVMLLFVIAYLAGKKETSTKDYFLGNRRMPAIIVCLSFVATEVSAATIIGAPAASYAENWNYIQFFFGSALARILVAFIFLPVFFKIDCTSIYEYLRQRFGPKTQYAGSVCFFITRLAASGFRLYLACLAVTSIMGWKGLLPSLVLFSAISIVFIAFGGIKAVVWNGAYQTFMFYIMAVAVIVFLLWQIPDGLGGVMSLSNIREKTKVFIFDTKQAGDAVTYSSGIWGGIVSFFSNPTSFWAGATNAFIVGLVMFGTDQELVQRLLTVKTRKASQKAIIFTIVAVLPLLIVYLGVGTLLYAFYQFHPEAVKPEEAKNVLPFFAGSMLPAGLKGLVLAVVILASIDSPLSSLSSSFVTDIYRPLIRRNATERHYLWVSRCGVMGFGVVLAVIAWFSQGVKDVLWFSFEIVSVTGGSILGVFLFGLLTRRRSAGWGNVAAMVIASLIVLVLLLLCEKDVFVEGRIISLGWSWLITIGTLLSFSLAYLLSMKDREQEVAHETQP